MTPHVRAPLCDATAVQLKFKICPCSACRHHELRGPERESQQELHEWHEGDGADQIFHRTVPEHHCAGQAKNASVSREAVFRFVTGEMEPGEERCW